MSDDIRCFHSSWMDAQALPTGWYVGTFAHETECVEAVGPYSDEMTAAIKMTTRGGCVWLHGDPKALTYAWNGTAFEPRRPNPERLGWSA